MITIQAAAARQAALQPPTDERRPPPASLPRSPAQPSSQADPALQRARLVRRSVAVTAAAAGSAPGTKRPALAYEAVREAGLPLVWLRRRQRLVRAAAVVGAKQPGPMELLLQQRTSSDRQQHLGHVEQRELAVAAHAGDRRAAAILVNTSRGLVQHIARRHAARGLSHEDLVAEGMIALEHAAVRYRPDRGASFSTFAATAISNGMTRAIHNLSRAIRLPAHQYADMARVKQATLEFVTRHRRQPSAEDIAQCCSFSLKYTVHLVKALRDQPGSSKVMLLALEDRLSASADDPFEKHNEVLEAVGESWEEQDAAESRWMTEQELDLCLAKLPEHQAEVVGLRHGLDNGGEMRTFKQIGQMMKFSGSWASMQYKLGERKLQAFILGTEQAPPTPSSSSSNAAGTQRGAAAAHYDQPAADAPSALATALTSLKPSEVLATALRCGWVTGEQLSWKEVGAQMNRTANGAFNLFRKANLVLNARLESLGHPGLDLTQFSFSLQQREAWQRELQHLQQQPASRRGGYRGGKAASSARSTLVDADISFTPHRSSRGNGNGSSGSTLAWSRLHSSSTSSSLVERKTSSCSGPAAAPHTASSELSSEAEAAAAGRKEVPSVSEAELASCSAETTGESVPPCSSDGLTVQAPAAWLQAASEQHTASGASSPSSSLSGCPGLANTAVAAPATWRSSSSGAGEAAARVQQQLAGPRDSGRVAVLSR